MAAEGWTRFKTQEAANSFRHEHYLFVYTVALELTGSPAEAHRLAAQVFANVRDRFADVPLSKNCDHFLAAQVNLLYAKGLQKSGRNPQRENRGRFTAHAIPMAETAEAENAPDEMAEGYDSQPEEMPAAASPLPQKPAESTFVMETAPREGENNPAVYITISVGTGSPAIACAPSTGAAAPAETQAAPRVTWIPAQPTASPAQTAATAAPVKPAVPAAPILPERPSAPLREALIPQTTAPVSYPPPAAQPEPPQAAAAGPKENPQPTQEEVPPAAPAPKRIIYDPNDTEYWAPAAEAVDRMVAEPLPGPEADLEGSEEKHSAFLTILNGLLTIGVVGLIIYLLVRLNGTYKFF